jgi:hypothetical protein
MELLGKYDKPSSPLKAEFLGSMTLCMGNTEAIADQFLKIYIIKTSGLLQDESEA